MAANTVLHCHDRRILSAADIQHDRSTKFMKPSARVIQHSVNSRGIELISFEVALHRWILAEVNTHRDLSRNYRSSRAVPVVKLLREVRESPAMPVEWMANGPGMMPTEPMTAEEEAEARIIWMSAAADAVSHVERLAATRLHKQWANRLLEPYLFCHGVITATNYKNMYSLRCHKAAQAEFRVLANLMRDAAEKSLPVPLAPGEWHLPYVTSRDREWVRDMRFNDPMQKLREMSVPRVARVSVNPHDETSVNPEKDFGLHDRLLADKHMSPFEHQATADAWNPWSPTKFWRPAGWANPGLHGNFRGYCQYRKYIPGEAVFG
jgi:hypothetical protein